MATLVHNCPHCGSKNMGFTVHGISAQNPVIRSRYSTHFLCNNCGNPVLVITDGATGCNPAQTIGDIAAINPREPSRQFRVLDILPHPEKIEIPDHLPDNVAQAFAEGCDILFIAPTSAATAFRRTLELALKDLSPDIEAWKLEKRIDKMAEQGLLTESLKDWAHQLRLDGNSATHEGETGTKETASQMRELTRFVLMYLYTLPGQMKAARGN